MRYLCLLFVLFFAPCAFALQINSDSFQQGSRMNSLYTCDSDNISPALNWSDVPAGTKSFALICEDPDSPSNPWSHWVVFNIPADKAGLEENMPRTSDFDNGMVQGVNDFGKTGYDGPCPPPTGSHRYFFRLYALDNNLLLDKNATKDAVLGAINGHVLSQAEIFCTYER